MSRSLVLNADDFGYEPRVTAGIEQAMRHGLVSSATMMVTTPYSEQAAAHASGLSLGLHLELARFESVSQPGRRFVEAEAGALTADFVEAEALAQVERFHRLLGREPTHVDVHKHLHRHPNVLEGLVRAAKVHGLAVRSIDDGMRSRLVRAGVRTNDAFLGDAGGEAYWTVARFLSHLDALPEDGLVELMCHPGYTPVQVASGYGAQREVELATLCSDEARLAMEARGLHFVSWTEALANQHP
jgi:predicted glycoside hydrolase/deacetylase ChbG (UPF0249 family)